MPRKVKTLKQISEEYGVHCNTLKRWIRPILSKLKLGNRRILLGWQVDLIYDLLDKPEGIVEQ